jgi:hypothetical protein
VSRRQGTALDVFPKKAYTLKQSMYLTDKFPTKRIEMRWRMDTRTVTLELPDQLYTDLQSLAAENRVGLVEILTRWVTLACQRRAWLRRWEELGELVRQDEGLQIGAMKEEIVEQMRKTRREIFEAKYAHLYR